MSDDRTIDGIKRIAYFAPPVDALDSLAAFSINTFLHVLMVVGKGSGAIDSTGFPVYIVGDTVETRCVSQNDEHVQNCNRQKWSTITVVADHDTPR